MYKRLLTLGVMLICFVVLSAVALAVPVTIKEVQLDDVVLTEGVTNILEVERGQEVVVEVLIKANADIPGDSADNLQVEAVMRGSDHKEFVEDITPSFRLLENVETNKKLRLRVPSRLEQDRFKLRIRVDDRDTPTLQKDYEIQISAKRHDVTIRDIILKPEGEIKAGRTFGVSLRLKNTGQKDEKSVKVRLSIPELGVSGTEYVNELEKEDDDNDQATSPTMLLRIPDDAETGTYTLKAEVYFDDGDEIVTKETKVRVVGEEKAVTEQEKVKKEEKTVIFVPTESQALTAGGQELFYPITITNLGTESKAYIVSVDSVGFGTVRMSPSNVAVVSGGESKTINIHVAANANAQEGEQIFLATIKTGDRVLKQIPLKAVISKQVAQAQGFRLKTVLEVLTLVLLVLVIIIVLVFGLSRIMKGDKEDKGKDEETYY